MMLIIMVVWWYQNHDMSFKKCLYSVVHSEETGSKEEYSHDKICITDKLFNHKYANLSFLQVKSLCLAVVVNSSQLAVNDKHPFAVHPSTVSQETIDTRSIPICREQATDLLPALADILVELSYDERQRQALPRVSVVCYWLGLAYVKCQRKHSLFVMRA